MARCIIIGAGDLTVSEIPLQPEDFVIAVDGGMDYLEFLQIEPDLILGDFDSVTESMTEAINKIEESNPQKVIRLNPIKDDTDTMYAIKEGLRRGYRDFRLYALTGGRFDHSFANVQVLNYLKSHDASGYLMDGNGMMFIIKDEAVHFRADMSGILSLFSLVKESKGVSIQGLKYEMDKGCISNDFPIGISNEFMEREATVMVEDGELLCVVLYDS